MPRTGLRYAIERFTPEQRKQLLAGDFKVMSRSLSLKKIITLVQEISTSTLASLTVISVFFD